MTDHNLPPAPDGDYAESGVPSFDYVRDQIESRFTTALGSTELAGEQPEAAEFEEKFTAREQAGRDKLEEIRRSLNKD
ncbi:hypothetical protein [Tamaricihabitans halophyticus]|nr:hypothetical protein [Tamaricihabitans halophyticus]